MSEGAKIRVLPDPGGGPAGAYGPVKTVQAAQLELPVEMLEDLWRAENLERLARAYWAFLERISLGLLKVIYTPSSRTVVLLNRRIPLLRFRRPSYEVASGLGAVTWPIERGILVARRGRGRGRLRITVRRLDDVPAPEGSAVVWMASEVSNFYPGLRLGGPLVRLGAWLYNQTQMRIHVVVTHGFFRSLTDLELPDSRIGSLSSQAAEEAGTRRARL
jgi:hypothetical protein